MAATSQNQHRCVFVGNIPYDATEEQLIKICEEVGPVVSFRLVTDRETGKPKGYGFCEYKDEETALSARRNLQGYEVNGRQLRVDFAENDKNTDRNREQGRGGPGTVTSVDPQKQFGVSTVHRDQSLLQPVGDSVAMAAATVMAGALGSAQTASTTNQVGLQNQTMLGTDPLTRYLAKMSRSQLTEIMSELKATATQDKDQARMLLLAIPNLPKALFQAQIMLGMVSPQMLQMPNIRQASPVQSIQSLPGLPPLIPQNKMQYGLLPNNAHESQVPSLPMPSQIQRPQLVQNQVPLQQQGLPLPSVRPQSLGGLSARPHIQPSTPSPLNLQFQPSLSQHPVQVPPINSAYHGHLVTQSATTQTSALMRPQFSAESYQDQARSSTSSENMDLKGRVSSLAGNTRIVGDSIIDIDPMNRPSKMMKFNDGRAPASSQATPLSVVSSQISDLSGRQTSMAQETLNSGRQVNQMQLPSDVDSALLQQVLNLTPEQLNSLPPDQQRQVIQLQQMLRQAA